MNILIMFGSNWVSGFREEDWNVKVYRRRHGRQVMTLLYMTFWFRWAKSDAGWL